MAISAYDQLVQACREAETWPLNLLRKQQLNRVLWNYQQRLLTDENRLLDSKQASVEFWEAPFGAESKYSTPAWSGQVLADTPDSTSWEDRQQH